MKVIKLEVDGQLVLSIVFEEEQEIEAVKELAANASTIHINEFMGNMKLAKIANENFLVPIMRRLSKYA